MIKIKSMCCNQLFNFSFRALWTKINLEQKLSVSQIVNLRYKLTLRSCHMHHNLCSIKKEVYRFNHLRARLNRYRKTRFTRVSMDVRRPSVPVMQKKFKKRCPDSGLDQKSGYLWKIMIYGSKTKNFIFSLFVCDTLCVLCSSVIVNFLFRPRASSVKQSIPFIT